MRRKRLSFHLMMIDTYILFSTLFFCVLWELAKDNDQLYQFFGSILHIASRLSILYLCMGAITLVVIVIEIIKYRRGYLFPIVYILISAAIVLAIGLYMSTIQFLYA